MRCPRDPVVAGQRIEAGPVAESPQAQHRLPETGQRSAAPRVPAAAPLVRQQLRKNPEPESPAARGGRLSKPVTTGETVRLGRLVETFLVTNVGERQVICCLADFGRDLRAEGDWRGFASLDSTSIGAKLARYPIRSDR